MRTLPAQIFAMVALTIMTTASMHAHARGEPPPPYLTTDPSPPPENQPFDAMFHLYWFPSAFGVRQDEIQIDGNIITVPFDAGCGWICPGRLVYSAYPFQLPALPPGNYRVRVVEVSGPYVYAEFSLGIGAISIPTYNTFTYYALILLLLVVGSMYSARNKFAHRG